MFKRLRIAVLLYVLVFVAAAQLFTAKHSKSWVVPLWVDVYLVDADGAAATRQYLDGLTAADLDGVESFFAAEAARHGLDLDKPFRLAVAGRHAEPLPALAAEPSMLGTLWWSLRMRWLAAALQWRGDGPSGDIVLFMVFHERGDDVILDGSTALEKGLIAVAHVFADDGTAGSNRVIVAHELLHTLGASDKYDPSTNAPRFPQGYAAPDAQPRLPQKKAELMAGRIPLTAQHAVIPDSLRQVVIGPETAREIGWRR